MRRLSLLCVLLSFIIINSYAQAPKRYTASEIEEALHKVNVLGSVLYLAAHPDDENTRLIAYLANEEKYRTGYLSLTRGDGGQNLIGSEIREKLGVIRTQELLAARRIDKGEQFFTRANDFGYSKHPDETFTIWSKEQILADVVWVIRRFRPDVIITRFSTEPGITHGHHTASAILAEEAFEAAADPKRFPEQLKYVQPWQVKKLYWNTSSWFYQNKEDFDTANLLKVDVGAYNPYLGKSYTELAAESRSMHKSQGFGASLTRGTTIEYLQPIKGERLKEGLFAGINTCWTRIEGGEKVGELIDKAIRQFKASNPASIIPVLVDAYQTLEDLPKSYYQQQKKKEIQELIRACAGLYLEANADASYATPGDSVVIALELVNRSNGIVTVNHISIPGSSVDTALSFTLKNNQPLVLNKRIQIPANKEISQPYWLVDDPELGMFMVKEQEKIGMPENTTSYNVQMSLEIHGQPFEFVLPVTYKKTDPVKGEYYEPFYIVPDVVSNFNQDLLVFPDDKPKTIQVMVEAKENNVKGSVELLLPKGWKATPAQQEIYFSRNGEAKQLTFQVTPPKYANTGLGKIQAKVKGQVYTKGMVTLNFDHIPKQVLFPESVIKLVRLDLKKKGERIGYIQGAGDDIPQILQEIGYTVDVLKSGDLELKQLKKYDAVILGVRAYNTIDDLKFKNNVLHAYAKQGGNVIVQYNTNFRLVTNDITPFPLKLSRDRVTVENAEVTVLQPNHPVLIGPNKITKEDFENWVQERGLYFPSEWSKEWIPLLSSHDPGESPKEGGLLVAKHGEGYYIYTGYSWFRQLPAGVPGAIRLFTNLISLGKK